MPANKKGFTLIEVLVVMVIITIIFTFVTLNFNTNLSGDKKLEHFANRISMIITMAQQEAALKGVNLKFVVEEKEFGFKKLKTDKKVDSWYFDSKDKVLSNELIPKGINMELTKTDESSGLQHFIIFSTGDITEFTLVISTEGGNKKYAINGKANGEILLEAKDIGY